jgi:hypothetical protein
MAKTGGSGATGMFRIGGTGMYAIPPQVSAKFPEEYLERTLAEIKIGEHVVVDASSLVVDTELNCWLKPDVVIGSDAFALSSATPCVGVMRDERGYVVSLQASKGRRWRAGPKPEPVDGVAWIPVVEVRF